MYKYDLHIHTVETSSCSHMHARDIVEHYHAAGYQGIAITDHFYDGFFQSLPEFGRDWTACADHFLRGYRLARERGAELGMDVLLGIEMRFTENWRDILIFGLDDAFLYRNPYCYEMGLERFFGAFKDEVLLIAAHPYRKDMATGHQHEVLPQFLHGVEVFNCNVRQVNCDHQALKLCRAHPELIRVIGSDAHQPVDLCASYVGFPERIADSAALRRALIGRDYVIGYPADPALAEEFMR